MHATLRQIEFLRSLARHRHFGKAAEECHLTQSAFSIGIKKLEEQLDLRLIDRSHKKVVLTAAGVRLAEQAEQVLQQARLFHETASLCKEPFSGSLRLGVIPTIAPFSLPHMLPLIKERWPQLKLSVREDTTAQLHRELLEGDLDLILIALPYDLGGIESVSLFKDYFKVVYRENSELFGREFDESELPAASILLLEDGHCLRNQALSVCSTEHHKKLSPYAASSLHTLVQMVNNDLGVSFVTELAIAGGLLENTHIKTQDMTGDAYREIGFGWRKNNGRIDEFQQFADFFTQLDPRSRKIAK